MSQQINLFNPIFLQQEKQFSAATMAQGLGVIAVAVLAFAGYSSHQAAQAGKAAAAAASALKASQERLAAMVEKARPAPPDKRLEEEIQQAETRLRASQQILDFVQNGQFREGQGYSRYLRALSGRVMPGVWLTGISIGVSNEIEITGRAVAPELVPAYIRSLNAEAAFSGKSLGSMELRAQQAAAQPAQPGVPGSVSPARHIAFALRSSEAGRSPDIDITGGAARK